MVLSSPEQEDNLSLELIQEDEILLKESSSGNQVHIKIHEIDGIDTITSNFLHDAEIEL